MQILNVRDPLRYLLWFFVCVLQGVHIDHDGAGHVFALHIFQLKDGLVFVVKAWLVKDCDSQILFLTIRLWHLKEGIHFAYSWDVVRDERLDLGIKFALLRFVSLDVLEELLHII